MSDLSQLNTSVLFTNWTTEDFTYKWGGQPYTFRARSSEQISVGTREHNEGLAAHFAKHLVDRELNKRGVPTDHFTRQEFVDNCYLPLEETHPVPVLEVTLHQDTGLVHTVKKVGMEDPVSGKVTKTKEEVLSNNPDAVPEAPKPRATRKKVEPVVEEETEEEEEEPSKVGDKNEKFTD